MERRRDFSSNFANTPSSESPLKVLEHLLVFFYCQFGNKFRLQRWNFTAHLEYIFFFNSAIHNHTSKSLSKLRKLNTSAIDKGAVVFVPPLSIGKWRNVNTVVPWPVPVGQTLRNLQRCGAFIASFTSEKWWLTIKQSLFRNWQLIPNFFIEHLPILEQCKPKGAFGAVLFTLYFHTIWIRCLHTTHNKIFNFLPILYYISISCITMILKVC